MTTSKGWHNYNEDPPPKNGTYLVELNQEAYINPPFIVATYDKSKNAAEQWALHGTSIHVPVGNFIVKWRGIPQTIESKGKYFERSQGYSEIFLIDRAYQHFIASIELYKIRKPYPYISAGYLLHVSIELILKSCALYKNDKFLKSHKLNDLIKDTGFLTLASNAKQFFSRLKYYESLRYDWDRHLSNIGQGDENEGLILLEHLQKQMPVKLRAMFMNSMFKNIIKDFNSKK